MSAIRPIFSKKKNWGFTLIETALAMLVIGLGILAIFGLGRHGLKATQETLHDERCQRMAQAIFSTLQTYNDAFIRDAYLATNRINQTRGWLEHWNQVANNRKRIPFPPIAGMRSGSTQAQELLLLFHTFQKGDNRTPAFDENNIDLLQWNPFYTLSLTYIQKGNDFSLCTSKDPKQASQWPDSIHVSLLIYPDGNTYSSETRYYYTTLSFKGGVL